jgi:hypothetical protein
VTPIPDPAEELVELVCKALGTSLRHYMPTTKRAAIEAAGAWITARDASNEPDVRRP